MENTEKQTVSPINLWGYRAFSNYIDKSDIISQGTLAKAYKKVSAGNELVPDQIKLVNYEIINAVCDGASDVIFTEHSHSNSHVFEDGGLTYGQIESLYEILRDKGYDCFILEKEDGKPVSLEVDLQELYEVNSEE
ncbi:MAG: hypothetical protein [Caudoviricetes sp.]|nr:MAG: hypothetical protein [Caudoviricetes sp.]